jgi:transposase
MISIGSDYHPRFQKIAMLDQETGELTERRLEHENGEAKRFYASLPKGTLVGIEATGITQWFERLMAECGHELWVGDPAEIRARRVRRQKTDRRDAEHLLELLLTNRFPRVWVPTPEERDARQLLRHRHKLVQMRTAVKNQLHALAMSQGLCRKHRLWSELGRQQLEGLELGPWASRRRQELLKLLDELDPPIAELDRAVQAEALRRPAVRRLMELKGVASVVGLAFVLTLGPVSRFQRSRQVVSYLGLNPREDSSGGHQHLGHISKQGNTMMRWLLVEAGQTAARCDPELSRVYKRLKFRRGANVAKVAIARRLAVRMDWKLRQAPETAPPVRMPGSPTHSRVDHRADSVGTTPSTL